MICVLQKEEAALIPWLALDKHNEVFSSLKIFSEAIQAAYDRQAFDQCVIVGSQNDIAWVRASLPIDAQNKLIAEIAYPLLGEWLCEPTLQQLIATLTPLMQ